MAEHRRGTINANTLESLLALYSCNQPPKIDSATPVSFDMLCHCHRRLDSFINSNKDVHPIALYMMLRYNTPPETASQESKSYHRGLLLTISSHGIMYPVSGGTMAPKGEAEELCGILGRVRELFPGDALGGPGPRAFLAPLLDTPSIPSNSRIQGPSTPPSVAGTQIPQTQPATPIRPIPNTGNDRTDPNAPPQCILTTDSESTTVTRSLSGSEPTATPSDMKLVGELGEWQLGYLAGLRDAGYSIQRISDKTDLSRAAVRLATAVGNHTHEEESTSCCIESRAE